MDNKENATRLRFPTRCLKSVPKISPQTGIRGPPRRKMARRPTWADTRHSNTKSCNTTTGHARTVACTPCADSVSESCASEEHATQTPQQRTHDTKPVMGCKELLPCTDTRRLRADRRATRNGGKKGSETLGADENYTSNTSVRRNWLQTLWAVSVTCGRGCHLVRIEKWSRMLVERDFL